MEGLKLKLQYFGHLMQRSKEYREIKKKKKLDFPAFAESEVLADPLKSFNP